MGKDSNKQDTLRLNNIPEGSKKVYDKIAITYDVVKEKGKDVTSTSIVNANDNKVDENGNDKSGISAKVVTNVLSVEGRAVEEEEFKKKTDIKITKTKEKENVKDGEKNTYNIVVKNIGDNPARIVKIEDTIEGKSTIDKDSIRVLNSKGEDVTNSKNIIGIVKEDRKDCSRIRQDR